MSFLFDFESVQRIRYPRLTHPASGILPNVRKVHRLWLLDRFGLFGRDRLVHEKALLSPAIELKDRDQG